MTAIERQIRRILSGSDLVLVDVGAAYGLPAHLQILERLAYVHYFEPDPSAAEQLRDSLSARGISKSKVFIEGLSDGDGERILYATNISTGASLLRPGGQFVEEFDNSRYFYPMREIPIPTRTLVNVLREAGVKRFDGIKIDVQGAELLVLKGAGDMLAGAQSVEMEIGFPGSYLDQPKFAEFESMLTGIGFALFDLRVANFHRDHGGDFSYYPSNIFRVDEDSPSLTKRIAEADAIYFKRADKLVASGDVQAVRRGIVLRCCYGFFPDALDLADKTLAAGLIKTDEHLALHKAVIVWQKQTQDVLFDRLFVVRVLRLMRRGWRSLQRRLFGRHFQRWRA